MLAELKALGIGAIFHYVPLDSSPAGRRYGRAAGPLPVTHDIADRLVRLPLWVGVEDRVDAVIDAARSSIGSVARVG